MILADHVKMLLLHFSTVFVHWKWAKLAQVCQQVELTLHCQMCTSVGLCHAPRSFQTETSNFPNILWHCWTTFFASVFCNCFISETLIFFLPKLIGWSAFYCFIDFSEPPASALLFFSSCSAVWGVLEYRRTLVGSTKSVLRRRQSCPKEPEGGFPRSTLEICFFCHGILEF